MSTHKYIDIICVAVLLLTLLLTRNVKKIDMVEALKSVE